MREKNSFSPIATDETFKINKGLHCVKCVQIRSFFWSIFSRIRTVYGEILRISPYSVRIRENTDQKKLRIWTHFTQCLSNYYFKKIVYYSEFNNSEYKYVGKLKPNFV